MKLLELGELLLGLPAELLVLAVEFPPSLWQLPNAGWQPAPQCKSLLPHHPNCEQQLPRTTPAQVTPFPQLPSRLCLRAPVDGVGGTLVDVPAWELGEAGGLEAIGKAEESNTAEVPAEESDAVDRAEELDMGNVPAGELVIDEAE
jgi:hypothetical protein